MKTKGEYFADYDEIYDTWHVFHTDNNTGHSYASFSTQSQAEENATQRNTK